MIYKLFLSFVFLILFLSGSASAFLISDQGTSVRNLTGSLLENGNLTIAIYDNFTAGNLIFSSTTSGAIVNGSWNLMINPSIEYGVRYWKDYEINGEDLDFDGNERLEFQSSVGFINNFSFINFSLINSCAPGSSIRSIYSNGSVECETDDSGNGTASDLINYALKNQSEIFSGNITTAYTGFFGFLGSLANRITKLFVNDLDASGSVNVTGNVTATYFKGDGSLLTNLPAGSETDPIFVAENTTLWSSINSKLSQSDQRYNDTALIVSVNRTTNIMSLGFYNRTEVDGLISGISGGNSSFNQSLTDTLYYSISNPSGFVNSSVLVAYNETSLILTTNSSLWNYINSNQASWNSTFNSTYNNLLGQQCPVGRVVNGTLLNGNLSCVIDSTGSGNVFNQVLNTTSNVTFANVTVSREITINGAVVSMWLYNQSDGSYNVTYSQFSYNQSTPAVNDVNLRFWNTTQTWNVTQLYNKTEINAFNASWTSTFNSTYSNILNQQCPLGLVVNGTLVNGTFTCVTPSAGVESDPLWAGNLTSGVSSDLNPLTNIIQSLGSSTKRWLKGWFRDLDVSNNIGVSGNVSAQFYFGSLNSSTFPTSSCSGTDKVVSISSDGTVNCGADEVGTAQASDTRFMNILAGAVTDTNAPVAERIVGNSQYLVCTNATSYSQFRYGFARSATNGGANAIVYMKYIVNPATTITGSSYTNLSNSSTQILSYTTANIANLSAHYTMNDSLGDICIGAFQVRGDGVLDPQWRNIWVELS